MSDPNILDFGWKVWDIARIAHEVNKAYCEAIGDFSQVPWEEAPDWQQESSWNGVMAFLEAEDRSPGASHRNWLKHKEEDGWVWGEIKDPEAKTHPCMLPFEKLPIEQQIKDHLFTAVIKAHIRTVA